MPVIVWNADSEYVGSIVRTGRRFTLSAEEFRPEAEALDRELDDLLDMAFHALTVISRRAKSGKIHLDSFEQVWVLGRAVTVTEILRHDAMQGEIRTMLWQAIMHKAWHGIRSNASHDDRWQLLLPRQATMWQNQPTKAASYKNLEVGYWLRDQQLHDAGEVFGWKYSNALALYDRSSLRAPILRQEVLHWLRRQHPRVREELAKGIRGPGRFGIVSKALSARFPAYGPGSALLPQHYPEDELREIVCETLDTARDLHFPQK